MSHNAATSRNITTISGSSEITSPHQHHKTREELKSEDLGNQGVCQKSGFAFMFFLSMSGYLIAEYHNHRGLHMHKLIANNHDHHCQPPDPSSRAYVSMSGVRRPRRGHQPTTPLVVVVVIELWWGIVLVAATKPR